MLPFDPQETKGCLMFSGESKGNIEKKGVKAHTSVFSFWKMFNALFTSCENPDTKTQEPTSKLRHCLYYQRNITYKFVV